MARVLGQAGRGQHRSGVALRRPGVPHSRRAAQEEAARGQRGEGAQRPG